MRVAEMDDFDEHPEDDEPERENKALIGSASFEFNFGEGKEAPSAVYIILGLIIMGACAALFTYTDGFGVTDLRDSDEFFDSLHLLVFMGFIALFGLLLFISGVGKLLGISTPGVENLEKFIPTESDDD